MTKKKDGAVDVRLLVDCEHGKCNQVVSLPADAAEAACLGGLADANAPAVDAGEVVTADK